MGVAIIATAITTFSIAQKTNETSAAVEKNNAQKAMMSGNMEGVIKHLKSAKEYIDKAAVHEDTKDNQKTLWLIGEIYGSLFSMAKLTNDSALVVFIGDNALETSCQALKRGYPLGKKYKSDIIGTVDQFRTAFNGAAIMLYEKEDFENAAFFYNAQAEYANAVSMTDTLALFNSAICYERSKKYIEAANNYKKLADIEYNGTQSAVYASRAYRNAGEIDKAKAVVSEARAKHPSDKDLLTELVNTNIESGNTEGAEKALNDAIAEDPNNKQLHYTIGTIYIDLKENQKAEDALKKALDIDPDYTDVQYQLGAHLYNWSNELKLIANKMDKGDPEEKSTLELAEAKMSGALEVLEQYITKDPNNKGILDILYKGYYKSGNKEKSDEYKARLEAL